jgi:hypothetical protein
MDGMTAETAVFQRRMLVFPGKFLGIMAVKAQVRL